MSKAGEELFSRLRSIPVADRQEAAAGLAMAHPELADVMLRAALTALARRSRGVGAEWMDHRLTQAQCDFVCTFQRRPEGENAL